MSSNVKYSIIAFSLVFFIFLNAVSIAYGESIVKNADFIDKIQKQEITSGGVFSSLSFLIFVDVPTSSKYVGTIGLYQGIYWGITAILIVLNLVVILELVWSH